MIGPVAQCEICGQSWDTLLGYICPRCSTELPNEVQEKFEKEHQETFRSMLTSPEVAPKPDKPWYANLVGWFTKH